jgi:hypothetical protein
LKEEPGWFAVVGKPCSVVFFADIGGDFDLGGVKGVFVYLSADLERKGE